MAKTTEQMLAEAAKAGVAVTVTESATGGEIAPLPGIRPKPPEPSGTVRRH